MSVVSGSAHVIYSYSGDKLISMHFYEKPGNLLYHIDSFQYSNDTLLSRMISHDYDMYNHYDTVHSVLDFIYNAPFGTPWVFSPGIPSSYSVD